jgi:thiol-disulfide isomerase/thioredoxin
LRKLTPPFAAACALVALGGQVFAQTTPPPAPAVRAPAVRAPAASAGRPLVLTNIPESVLARELTDLDGQPFQLSDFRGRVLVINIWATWCGPCRVEMPELNKLHEEFSPRGVAFVGLTTEDPEEDAGKVLAFVAQFKMKFPVGWIDGESFETLGNGRTNIPQTFVVAPDGRLVKHFVGYSPQKSPKLMRDAVRLALGDIP